MSIGIYPVLENGADATFDPDEGVLLLRLIEHLDTLAEERGLVPLSGFDAYSQMELPDDFDGDPDVLEDLQEQAEVEWHDSQDGVATLTELIEGLQSQPGMLDGTGEPSGEVIGALQDLKTSLQRAVDSGTRFHLRVG